MSNVNLRGAYMGFAHDRQPDWSFLALWQPSVVTLMLQGSATDPNSVSLEKVKRTYEASGGADVVLRCWDLDDHNGDAHARMRANPAQEAHNQVDWWSRLLDRIHDVPRNKLICHPINEPNPYTDGDSIFTYTETSIDGHTSRGNRFGLYSFGVGNPWLPGDGKWDWPFFARLEPKAVAGNHIVIVHEYLQPEGTYFEWIDDQGNHRSDFGNLIGRHLHSTLSQVPIYIEEWGIEGLIFNRHPDPQYGNSGWLNFKQWTPDRFADEYGIICSICASNVYGIAPFGWDLGSHQWDSFDQVPAEQAYLQRKDNYVKHGSTLTLPIISTGDTGVPKPPPVQPSAPIGNTLDPYALEAITRVEAGTILPLKDRMPIRFEAHIFKSKLGNDALWSQHFSHDPVKPWVNQQWVNPETGQWEPMHQSQDQEWKVLQYARSLDDTAALLSTSMGAAQIMGFNYATAGYPSVQEMFRKFSISNAHQLFGLINYFLDSPELQQAVRTKDWRTVARLYNGPGNVDQAAPMYENAYQLAIRS